MNNKFIITFASAITTLFCVAAANAKDISADAVAIINNENLVIQQIEVLEFGELAVGATGGTYSVASQIATGDVVQLNGSNPAEFEVTGIANTAYNIIADSNVTLSSESDNMSATLTVPASSSLNGSGVSIFEIDGTISVAANQPDGDYSGQYNVSVSY
ncbi:MAG: hypothetical protein COV35_04235 [Alphaproteobacteria bacterium CG11_big_fil_rev_8_21_14_0_20_39_49]|nr:MAG: hypothetical protein COV35_04235 [Alphaproteobacteria bacterium CG11_big_fil_rev_8_21_14_0_20_39_49]